MVISFLHTGQDQSVPALVQSAVDGIRTRFMVGGGARVSTVGAFATLVDGNASRYGLGWGDKNDGRPGGSAVRIKPRPTPTRDADGLDCHALHRYRAGDCAGIGVCVALPEQN